MSVALASAVQGVISAKWQPNAALLAPDERENASRLWQELNAVVGAGCWRSSCLLSGQLVEAYLRSILVASGLSRSDTQRLRTFSVVIRTGRQRGLFGAAASAQGLLTRAINLRNESSHFAFWLPYTSPVEGAWAFVASVLLLEEIGAGSESRDPAFVDWLRDQVLAIEEALSRPRTVPSISTSLTTTASGQPHRVGHRRYSLKEVRSALLQGWEPPSSGFSPEEVTGIAALWSELKLVPDTNAWKALGSLSGQLVEAYMKSKLLHAGKLTRTASERMVLKPLIRRCDNEGLFARPENRTTTGADAVHSAEILRNWASHYAFWLGYTQELRGTQSLALGVSIIESLYPQGAPTFAQPPLPISVEWMTAHWQSAAAGVVFTFLERTPTAPHPFEPPTQEVLEHIVRFGTLSTLRKLFDWAKQRKHPLDDLGPVIHAYFPHLLRKAHRESIRTLMDTIVVFNSVLGYGDSDEPVAHVQVFGALLPIDTASLLDVFKLATSRIPLYLLIAKRSSGNLLDQGLRCPSRPCSAETCLETRCRLLIPAFWEAFDPSKNENPLNMANALRLMPDDVKINFLTRIPRLYLNSGVDRPFFEWLGRNLARNAANLLGSLKTEILALDTTGRLQELKRDIVDSITSAVARDSLQELSVLPRRLYGMGLADDDATQIVVRAIVERTVDTVDAAGNNSRRVLWDTYQYFPAVAMDAVRAARHVLEKRTVPAWDSACLAGMLEVDTPGSSAALWPLISWDMTAFERMLRSNVDRWQKLLALEGAFRRSAALGGLAPVIPSTTKTLLAGLNLTGSPAASVKLVEALERELRAMR